jgi:hypothetical protein
MGHPQPKTPVHCDNTTAVGIANNTIKRQRAINGNEIFLDWGYNYPTNVQPQVAPRPGKPSRLPEQTPHWLAPHSGTAMVLAFRKFPPGITMGKMA